MIGSLDFPLLSFSGQWLIDFTSILFEDDLVHCNYKINLIIVALFLLIMTMWKLRTVSSSKINI